MSLPTVAIVGRPNVGKSSLFNALAGKRLAIVDDQPGVTRDRVTFLVEHEERWFELVDTGGIGFEDKDDLTAEVEHQIDIAIEQAAVIVFVVDTRTGLTPHDLEVATRLRGVTVPVIVVANKSDADSLDNLGNEFFQLGWGEPRRVSAKENRGQGPLLDEIISLLPETIDEAPVEPEMKLAIVGRRNVGKSTFINSLIETDRMIVSEVPGTTRDSVDVRFEVDGQALIAIDTPGLRRRKSVTTDIDFYSTHRAQRSMRRADVVFLFFDCAEPISNVDKQLTMYIEEQFKPCIFVVNKWDLYSGQVSMDDWVQYLRDEFRMSTHVPISFITGKDGKNLRKLINHGQMLFKQSRVRVSTGELNRVLKAALTKSAPPMFKNRIPKIYYATQVDIAPPTIVLFCSDPTAISPNYQRYLQGFFRESLPFAEVPMKFYIRARSTKDKAGSKDDDD